MVATPASLITKAASKQAFYTIRLLADRERVEDAFRAYAYFRWVDDILDGGSTPGPERIAFLERQQSLLEKSYRGEALADANLQEQMLVELVRHDREKDSGLELYLRNMMQVMDFDARRRGRLISQAELNEYTRWLATAVMEAIHYFIGHDDFAPQDETRYLAVAAAHIAHMLRDTFEDVRIGYHNVPREVLEANHIRLQDVGSQAYRGWVRSRVLLAREYFRASQDYLAQVQNLRCRLACYAYIERFEWLLDTIEKEGYCLRPQYGERKSIRAALWMSWLTIVSMMNLRKTGTPSAAPASHPLREL